MKIKTEYEQILRIALTGKETGPNIYQLMEVMGKDRVMERLEYFRTVVIPQHKQTEDAMSSLNAR